MANRAVPQKGNLNFSFDATKSMLAKAGQDPLLAGPMNQRPVSVASALYRAYASIRYQQLCPWMESWVHENSRGGVPGGECKDLTLEMGLDIEAAAIALVEARDLEAAASAFADAASRFAAFYGAGSADARRCAAAQKRR